MWRILRCQEERIQSTNPAKGRMRHFHAQCVNFIAGSGFGDYYAATFRVLWREISGANPQF